MQIIIYGNGDNDIRLVFDGGGGDDYGGCTNDYGISSGIGKM